MEGEKRDVQYGGRGGGERNDGGGKRELIIFKGLLSPGS